MIGVARLLRGGVGGAIGGVGSWMVGISGAVVGGLLLALAVFETAMADESRNAAEMVALYARPRTSGSPRRRSAPSSSPASASARSSSPSGC